MSKFYSEYEDTFCLGAAVGRVALRIIGGICMGFGAIQIGLTSYIYSCSTDIIYARINHGGWWAGVAVFVTGTFGVWAINRGVVIAANIGSVISMILSGIAIYFDKGGITPLFHSNPTDGYCIQSFAAAFMFDVVIGAMAITMFVTTCISLLIPSCFNELSYETYKRREARQSELQDHNRDLESFSTSNPQSPHD